MKKIHIMLCLALGILVSGCFTSYVSTKQMMGIYQGMTQSQVESVLGKPDFRRFDGDMEEWEFHRDNGTPVLTSEPVTIIVQFGYVQRLWQTCTNAFRCSTACCEHYR